MLAIPICLLINNRSASAVNTTFTQQILPLNCIFTIINAGTGELHYVTPAACGVVPPVIASNNNSSNAAGSSYQNPSKANNLETEGSTYPNYRTQHAANFPWQPIVSKANSNPSSMQLTAQQPLIEKDKIVILSVVVFIAIVIVALIFLV